MVERNIIETAKYLELDNNDYNVITNKVFDYLRIPVKNCVNKILDDL